MVPGFSRSSRSHSSREYDAHTASPKLHLRPALRPAPVRPAESAVMFGPWAAQFVEKHPRAAGAREEEDFVTAVTTLARESARSADHPVSWSAHLSFPSILVDVSCRPSDSTMPAAHLAISRLSSACCVAQQPNSARQPRGESRSDIPDREPSTTLTSTVCCLNSFASVAKLEVVGQI